MTNSQLKFETMKKVTSFWTSLKSSLKQLAGEKETQFSLKPSQAELCLENATLKKELQRLAEELSLIIESQNRIDDN